MTWEWMLSSPDDVNKYFNIIQNSISEKLKMIIKFPCPDHHLSYVILRIMNRYVLTCQFSPFLNLLDNFCSPQLHCAYQHIFNFNFV